MAQPIYKFQQYLVQFRKVRDSYKKLKEKRELTPTESQLYLIADFMCTFLS